MFTIKLRACFVSLMLVGITPASYGMMTATKSQQSYVSMILGNQTCRRAAACIGLGLAAYGVYRWTQRSIVPPPAIPPTSPPASEHSGTTLGASSSRTMLTAGAGAPMATAVTVVEPKVSLFTVFDAMNAKLLDDLLPSNHYVPDWSKFRPRLRDPDKKELADRTDCVWTAEYILSFFTNTDIKELNTRIAEIAGQVQAPQAPYCRPHKMVCSISTDDEFWGHLGMFYTKKGDVYLHRLTSELLKPSLTESHSLFYVRLGTGDHAFIIEQQCDGITVRWRFLQAYHGMFSLHEWLRGFSGEDCLCSNWPEWDKYYAWSQRYGNNKVLVNPQDVIDFIGLMTELQVQTIMYAYEEDNTWEHAPFYIKKFMVPHSAI